MDPSLRFSNGTPKKVAILISSKCIIICNSYSNNKSTLEFSSLENSIKIHPSFLQVVFDSNNSSTSYELKIFA